MECMSVKLSSWITEHGVGEVECIIPDMNGVQRGKVLPAKKFLGSVKDGTLRIPGSIFTVTINGEYPEDIGHIIPEYDPDQIMVPDANTICEAPGFNWLATGLATAPHLHAAWLAPNRPRALAQSTPDQKIGRAHV